MPGMTGTEAMHLIRADSSFGNTPIIALTAHALDGERRHALSAGFDAVIAKPCLPDALVAAVECVLNDRTPGARTFEFGTDGPPDIDTAHPTNG